MLYCSQYSRCDIQWKILPNTGPCLIQINVKGRTSGSSGAILSKQRTRLVAGIIISGISTAKESIIFEAMIHFVHYEWKPKSFQVFWMCVGWTQSILVSFRSDDIILNVCFTYALVCVCARFHSCASILCRLVGCFLCGDGLVHVEQLLERLHVSSCPCWDLLTALDFSSLEDQIVEQ